MPYKLVAIKSLTAAAIMYATVMALYRGYVWPAVSLKPVVASVAASTSPTQTTTVVPADDVTRLLTAPPPAPTTPDIFISPKTQTQPAPVIKAEGGVKRSSSEVSEVHLTQLQVKQENIKLESGKRMKTEDKLKQEKGFSNTQDGLK